MKRHLMPRFVFVLLLNMAERAQKLRSRQGNTAELNMLKINGQQQEESIFIRYDEFWSFCNFTLKQ